MKFIVTIFFLLIQCFVLAQEQPTIKPICQVHVTTLGENKMKGLLLLTTDSALAVYPGKHKQWNKGKKYDAVVFTTSL